jgi:acyl carrier protein
MEINDFIANFADLFERTDKLAFTAQTQFRDLEEWSSLIGLSVMAMIDEEYDIKLKGYDIMNSHTIKELYDIVKSRIEVP